MSIKTKADLKTENNSVIYANTNKEISAVNVNALVENIIDSMRDESTNINIADLDDVDVTSVVDNDVLFFTGGTWKSKTVSTSPSYWEYKSTKLNPLSSTLQSVSGLTIDTNTLQINLTGTSENSSFIVNRTVSGGATLKYTPTYSQTVRTSAGLCFPLGNFSSKLTRTNSVLDSGYVDINFYSNIVGSKNDKVLSTYVSYYSLIQTYGAAGVVKSFESVIDPQDGGLNVMTGSTVCFGYYSTVYSSTLKNDNAKMVGVGIDLNGVDVTSGKTIGVQVYTSNTKGYAFQFLGNEAKLNSSWSNNVVTANPDAYVQILIGEDVYYIPAYSTKPA